MQNYAKPLIPEPDRCYPVAAMSTEPDAYQLCTCLYGRDRQLPSRCSESRLLCQCRRDASIFTRWNYQRVLSLSTMHLCMNHDTFNGV